MVEHIAAALKGGAVLLYPTDTMYAIGCDLTHREAITRVRQIKRLSNDRPLTFLCASLSNIADYAIVSDGAYRLMKRLIPGPYTFILPATKQVPKLVMNPKRKTTGIRVPDHPVCQALLAATGQPIISTSAHHPPGTELPPANACALPQAELFDAFGDLVDGIVDDGSEPRLEPSTILDLTVEGEPQVLRQGVGPV
jgi:tRNA threonylcarbamoyl adenosine modification protein (Sua5/YciO/YrdC/YwlC family)